MLSNSDGEKDQLECPLEGVAKYYFAVTEEADAIYSLLASKVCGRVLQVGSPPGRQNKFAKTAGGSAKRTIKKK